MRPNAAAAARIASVISTGASASGASASDRAAIVSMTRTAACDSSSRFRGRLLDPFCMEGSISPLLPFVKWPEEFGRRDVQRLGQLEDVVETGIPAASLHVADVVPIESGQLREPQAPLSGSDLFMMREIVDFLDSHFPAPRRRDSSRVNRR
jgi:hypothetical protein